VSRGQLDLLAGAAGLGGGELRAEPAVSDPAGPLESLGAAAAELYLERVLNGTDREPQAGGREAAGVVIHRFASPQAAYDPEGPFQQLAPGRT